MKVGTTYYGGAWWAAVSNPIHTRATMRHSMRAWIRIAALIVAGWTCYTRAAEPVPLILDTDIGNDIDDALALGLIHSLESRNEVRLLAVTITKDNRWAAPYVDLVDTFYGRPDIPIGVVHGGKTPRDSAFLTKPANSRDKAGNFVYPHRIQSGTEAPDAVAVLKQVLEAQPDGSVVIAQIGFSTNLARLLQTSGGLELATKKVKLLALMAGNFQKSDPEYNVYTDPESAQYVVEHWPTPMVFSGFEVGLQVKFTYRSITEDFRYTANHPIAEAYRIFLPKGEDRPSWDPTAVLYAIRPDRGYFELSAPGTIRLGPKSTTVFTKTPDGKCRYLIVPTGGAARVQAALEALVSEPPQCGLRSEVAPAAQGGKR
jgi:inosine-uridine nucleoside N-ribohydrolase